jgi:hypothetical protein
MVWAVSLSTTNLITRSPTADVQHPGIRSLFGFGKSLTPLPIQCSTSGCPSPTLVLKLFRGEQAISEFVWHITPNHRSSLNFAALKGSDLHEILFPLHPAHG